jgi:hypothetical protein
MARSALNFLTSIVLLTEEVELQPGRLTSCGVSNVPISIRNISKTELKVFCINLQTNHLATLSPSNVSNTNFSKQGHLGTFDTTRANQKPVIFGNVW